MFVVLHASAVRVLVICVCVHVCVCTERLSVYFYARLSRNPPHTCWAGLAVWVEGVSRAGFSSCLHLYLFPDYVTGCYSDWYSDWYSDTFYL